MLHLLFQLLGSVNNQKKGTLHFLEGKSLKRKLKRFKKENREKKNIKNETKEKEKESFGQWFEEEDISASMPGLPMLKLF